MTKPKWASIPDLGLCVIVTLLPIFASCSGPTPAEQDSRDSRNLDGHLEESPVPIRDAEDAQIAFQQLLDQKARFTVETTREWAATPVLPRGHAPNGEDWKRVRESLLKCQITDLLEEGEGFAYRGPYVKVSLTADRDTNYVLIGSSLAIVHFSQGVRAYCSFDDDQFAELYLWVSKTGQRADSP